MEMLSNGYGCIRKCSKSLKQSLFDWMLQKFNNLLTRTMSDIPTASTSAASTSSSASTSQINSYKFRLAPQDLEYSTTEESEISSDASEMYEEESNISNEIIECVSFEEIEDIMDDASWSSTATSTVSSSVSSSVSSTISYVERSSSENSENEKLILKERSADQNTTSEENPENLNDPPILIFVQPCESEGGEMNEIGMDLINVEEHAKRLRELEKELDFIEATEWMYRPLDSSIR